MIAPARDGSLRVLRAARDAKVKRVVMTSSCAAVYYGYPPRAEPFDETNWSNPDRGDMSAYVKSKLIAERAAWDFIKAEGGALELAVINPAGIFGPVLGPDVSSSTQMVKRLLTGMPGCPRIHFAVVDVRDVADLHLRAMTSRRGEWRAVHCRRENGGAMSMLEMANVLKARLGEAAKKVPTRELPDWIVRPVRSSIPPCASCCRCSARFATRPARRRGACSPGSRARARTRSLRRRRAS